MTLERNSPSIPDTNTVELIDRNGYLSTEVEKLKIQIELLKNENMSLKNIKVHSKDSIKFELQKENKSLKQSLDDLIVKNSQLVDQIESQGEIISNINRDCNETPSFSQKYIPC